MCCLIFLTLSFTLHILFKSCSNCWTLSLSLTFFVDLWWMIIVFPAPACLSEPWRSHINEMPWLQIQHVYTNIQRVSLLHAVLAGDGVPVLRVVQERHVDSNQRCPVSREDLTPDDWCQAVLGASKHRKGLSKQTEAASERQAEAETPLTAAVPVPAAAAGSCDLSSVKDTRTSGEAVIYENASSSANSLHLFTAVNIPQFRAMRFLKTSRAAEVFT